MLLTDDICDRPGLVDLEAALAIALGVVQPLAGRESVRLSHCAGRVSVGSILSAIPLPPYDQSAVDGYGIHADDIAAGETGPFRLVGLLVAGARRGPTLTSGEVVRLMTGAAIPLGVAAVVMEEKASEHEGQVRIGRPAEAGLNIRRAGEDVEERSEIVAAGTLLDARHVAIIAASGTTHVAVRRRVKVGILSTGDELVPAGRRRRIHQISDSNGPMLRALFTSPATDLKMLGCCADDPVRLIRQIKRAAETFDLLVCSGGVSGSDADHVVASVLASGGSCTKLSLALKPGKPLAVGRVGAMAVLALPGNPVAALVAALLFARPMLQTLSGQTALGHATIMAKTAATFSHRLGRTEFVPVRVIGHDEQGTPLLEKLGRGGSARLRPLVLADGLGRIPGENDDLTQGTQLRFYPFRTGFGL